MIPLSDKQDGDPECRVFGQRVPGVTYLHRPGSYVLFQNKEHFAIVKATGGFCLPGGGQEPGESPEQTAIRECWEEIGLKVKLIRFLGHAQQLAYGHPEQQYFHKLCAFYLAELASAERGPGEADHQLHWMMASQALEHLVHESEKWILQQHLHQSFSSEKPSADITLPAAPR
ncbi:MAG TPA: NUDIX domain-containing protein [Gemmatales bacterium]|nr:NUDIX domain-containing protein [Gemmatales bacterium]HMP17390.1 NUDIX domain-containing protein [Gemmatales bacterium]